MGRARPVDLLVAQGLRVEQTCLMGRVGALPVSERVSVGHDKLGVAGAGGVDAWVVDLAQFPAMQGVPDLARGATGCPEAVLVAGHPVARCARCARGVTR